MKSSTFDLGLSPREVHEIPFSQQKKANSSSHFTPSGPSKNARLTTIEFSRGEGEADMMHGICQIPIQSVVSHTSFLHYAISPT
jgi:hypothetical protein